MDKNDPGVRRGPSWPYRTLEAINKDIRLQGALSFSPLERSCEGGRAGGRGMSKPVLRPPVQYRIGKKFPILSGSGTDEHCEGLGGSEALPQRIVYKEKNFFQAPESSGTIA